MNVQLEVSKRFRSTLTPRELSTISTALEQRIVNSNYSIVIGGTVYRKNCVLYVTVKKPTDEVTDGKHQLNYRPPTKLREGNVFRPKLPGAPRCSRWIRLCHDHFSLHYCSSRGFGRSLFPFQIIRCL